MCHYLCRFAFSVLIVAAIGMPAQAQTPGPGGGGPVGADKVVGFGRVVTPIKEDREQAKRISDNMAQDEAEDRLRVIDGIITDLGGTLRVVTRGLTYSEGKYIPLGTGHKDAGNYVWESDYTITFNITWPPAPTPSPGPAPVPVPKDK